MDINFKLSPQLSNSDNIDKLKQDLTKIASVYTRGKSVSIEDTYTCITRATSRPLQDLTELVLSVGDVTQTPLGIYAEQSNPNGTWQIYSIDEQPISKSEMTDEGYNQMVKEHTSVITLLEGILELEKSNGVNLTKDTADLLAKAHEYLSIDKDFYRKYGITV